MNKATGLFRETVIDSAEHTALAEPGLHILNEEHIHRGEESAAAFCGRQFTKSPIAKAHLQFPSSKMLKNFFFQTTGKMA